MALTRVNYERLRTERMARARNAIEKHGLGALIAFKSDNVRYITDVARDDRPRIIRYCILGCNGDPILYELGGDLGRVRQQSGQRLGKNLRVAIPIGFCPKEIIQHWASEIKTTLEQEFGLRKGKVGIDMVGCEVAEALADAGITVVDGQLAMDDARMIKTQDEIECIRASVGLAELTFDTMHSMLRPGIRERDLQAERCRVLILKGADNFRGIVASGAHTNPYWRTFGSDRIIQDGELVIIDEVHMAYGYGSDYVRTFLCGDRATAEQRELHKLCYEKLYGAIGLVKPGNTTADVAEKLGEAEDWSESTLQFGHGVGLVTLEPPFITPASKDYPIVLRPNMVLSIEVYVGKPGGRNGVRLEEQFIVTEVGCEIISQYPFDPKLV